MRGFTWIGEKVLVEKGFLIRPSLWDFEDGGSIIPGLKSLAMKSETPNGVYIHIWYNAVGI